MVLGLGLGLGCLQDCRKWAGNGLVPKALGSTPIPRGSNIPQLRNMP